MITFQIACEAFTTLVGYLANDRAGINPTLTTLTGLYARPSRYDKRQVCPSFAPPFDSIFPMITIYLAPFDWAKSRELVCAFNSLSMAGNLASTWAISDHRHYSPFHGAFYSIMGRIHWHYRCGHTVKTIRTCLCLPFHWNFRQLLSAVDDDKMRLSQAILTKRLSITPVHFVAL